MKTKRKISKIFLSAWIHISRWREVKRKKREADRRNFKYGDTYYVLPVGKKLLVVNNRWRKHYNNLVRRSGSPKISYLDMELMSIYKAQR